MPCPFCSPPRQRVVFENGFFYAMSDINPVSKGHTIIIPKRHVISFFDMNQKESHLLFECLLKTKELLDRKFSPSGYNIAVNIGKIAGQSVMHAHIHLIPRYGKEAIGREHHDK